MNQKDYWNKAAADKEFTTPFQLAAFEKYVPREAAVLDVGRGYGRTLDELYRADWRPHKHRLFRSDDRTRARGIPTP